MAYTILALVFLLIAGINIWRLYNKNEEEDKKVLFKKIGFIFLGIYILIAGMLFIVFL